MIRMAGIRAFSDAAAGGRKKMLLLGLGGGKPPKVFPNGLTHEKLMAMLKEQNEALKQAGVDPAMLNLDQEASPDAIETLVVDALTQTQYDIVSIGAGVRTLPDHFLLFEHLVNIVHEHAPQARFAFDTGPGDKVESMCRQLPKCK